MITKKKISGRIKRLYDSLNFQVSLVPMKYILRIYVDKPIYGKYVPYPIIENKLINL